MHYTNVTVEQVNQWAMAVKTSGDARCAEFLVKVLTPFISKYARQQSNQCDDLKQDLMQEGALAVLKACKTFDPEKGNFSPIAMTHVKYGIKQYAMDQRKVVRAPDSKPVKKATNLMRKALDGRSSLSCEQVRLMAEQIGTTEQSILIAQGIYTMSNVSIDAPSKNSFLGDSGGDTLESTLTDGVMLEDQIEAEQGMQQAQKQVKELLTCLSEREGIVITSRKMFQEDEKPMTLQELSILLGVSCERVRQIEVGALGKMKQKALH